MAVKNLGVSMCNVGERARVLLPTEVVAAAERVEHLFSPPPIHPSIYPTTTTPVRLFFDI
jgi:hypothetical protein